MKRAVVLIVTDTYSRVLLLKRGMDHKHFPGQWCLPGGKVDYITQEVSNAHGRIYKQIERWEEDDEAAIRECKEEIGYVPALIQDTHITAFGSDGEFIVKVFKGLTQLPFLTDDNAYDKYITREFPNREHTEYAFFETNRLPADVGNLTKQIINQVIY